METVFPDAGLSTVCFILRIESTFATAVCSVAKALEEGKITKDDYVMLNVTGGGLIEAKKGGYVEKEPDLVLDPDLSAAKTFVIQIRQHPSFPAAHIREHVVRT